MRVGDCSLFHRALRSSGAGEVAHCQGCNSESQQTLFQLSGIPLSLSCELHIDRDLGCLQSSWLQGARYIAWYRDSIVNPQINLFNPCKFDRHHNFLPIILFLQPIVLLMFSIMLSKICQHTIPKHWNLKCIWVLHQLFQPCMKVLWLSGISIFVNAIFEPLNHYINLVPDRYARHFLDRLVDHSNCCRPEKH